MVIACEKLAPLLNTHAIYMYLGLPVPDHVWSLIVRFKY